MLGMSRCNVVFVSQLGRSTSDHNKQHWVAELQSLHLNTFIHNFASCAPLLLDFGVDGVRTIFQIQTYRTRFCKNLVLNELLTLSRQGAVVRDSAASIRTYNCNMALAVNFARADQSFVDV